MLHHSFFISGYFWLECSFRFIFMQLCYVLISCFALKNIFLCKVTELTMGVKIFWICISIFQLLWFQSILNSVCYLKIRGQTKGKQGGTRILSHQDNLFPKKYIDSWYFPICTLVNSWWNALNLTTFCLLFQQTPLLLSLY